jgi:SAM-dependent methyltransferase
VEGVKRSTDLSRVYESEVCDIFVRDRRKVIATWLEERGLLDGDRTVLDIGCGIGSFFKKYGSRFGEKLGTDHSQRMLEIAARICRRQHEIGWQQAEVKALPVEMKGRGDLVLCSNVITFVSLPDCRRAMSEVASCARKGGWVMLVQPALESHDRVARLEQRHVPPRRGDSAVVQRDDRRQRFFSEAGAAALAATAGLKSVEVRKVWYPWIDDGITAPPRGEELPWDWLVTGRR